ncbi:MAG: putative transporter [Bacteroidales bacterium]|nr:putative transporter [Bacteroidales bacterium]
MNWLNELITGTSIAHAVLVLSGVVALGVLLSRIKICGVSLGVTWILFVGIIAGHFGLTVDPSINNFIKEFGLILFVYSVGLQVGPGFFSSFKKGGLTLNGVAVLIVLMSVLLAYIIHAVTGTSLVTMVGVLCGAVTNTPGLGAAQQTYLEATGAADPSIAMGYAVSYPLGVVGIVMSIVVIKGLFGMTMEKELERATGSSADAAKMATKFTVEVKNSAIIDKTIESLHGLIDKDFVVSRLCRANGKVEIPASGTKLYEGDRILVISVESNMDSIVAFFGEQVEVSVEEWKDMDSQLSARKIIVTKHKINGKTLGELKVRSVFGVNVTRVNRAGIDLVAAPDLELQIGDRVLAVGDEKKLESFAKMLGNSSKQLREPNLLAIFLGIAVGVVFGSIPFMLPGMPQPVKMGLAGGPLIIAILISRFGYKFKVVTYTTLSANMMLREVGISLFLAAVGIASGAGFVDTVVNKGGFAWIGYGVIITLVPMLAGAAIGRFVFKFNYFQLMGLIAGSGTNPSGLAYSNSVSPINQQAVSYATVYPLVMFLRVLTPQILILMAL